MARRSDAKSSIPGPLELPGDYRHAYVQSVEGSSLFENALRAQAMRPEHGQIVDASYVKNRNIFDRIRGLFVGKSPIPTLALVPPFDPNGADRYGYFANATDVPFLDARGAERGQIRRIRGRIMALGIETPPDGALLRAYWLMRPPALHACEVVDIVICPDEGPAVVFSCEQSPLLIGRPTQVSIAGFLSRVSPRMRALLRAMYIRRSQREEGEEVAMVAGQMVEALFVVHSEVRGMQPFELDGDKRTLPMELLQKLDPYRGTSNLQAFIGGDAPGIRAVVRTIGE